ncbi:MAG: T9SS type A sorting domain-containing protein [Candidatus Delongbacteria bacterium]|jgi:hypothetical protein|nr:T9SS type A sorting domain-containing protein [Candidatus Delongbacteria bacterium]
MKKMLFYVFLCMMISYGYRSLPSEAVGVVKFENVTTRTSDLNHISLPFDAGYTLSSDIAPGTVINSISKWNPIYQGWRTTTFIPFNTIPWVNVYNITEGDALCVNAKISHSLYIAGKYIEIPQYQLIITEGADLNFIMHPIDKYNLNYAGDGVGNNIGVCNSITKWNAVTQSNITTTFVPGYGWENDFESKPGLPLFVNMTDSLLWPYEETKIGQRSMKNEEDIDGVNLPKVVYYHIVNSEGFDYDTLSKSISFKAWIAGREEDVLTESSYDCGFIHLADSLSSIYFNLGNFKSKWMPDENLNIEVTEIKENKNVSVTLEGSAIYTIEENTDAAIKGYDNYVKGSGDPIVVGTPVVASENMPEVTELYQNYPNPFNPETTIGYSLKNDCDVKLTVYNYKGQVANELVNGRKERGHHTVTFNADMLSSGVYFYTLEADGKKLIRKMVMVR